MSLSRRALLAEASRAAAVAGTAAVGLLGAHAARPKPPSIDPADIDPTLTVPTATQDLFLVPEPGRVVAFTRRCPHLGCRLNLDAGAGFVCPCHGSRFDRKGQRLEGPAVQNLSMVATVAR
jgi:Rieske Fe-S protein